MHAALILAAHHAHYSLAPAGLHQAGLRPAQVPWLIVAAICVLTYCVLSLRGKSRPR